MSPWVNLISGRRAKLANSSARFLIESSSWEMMFRLSSTMARNFSGGWSRLRRIRCEEIWIGVSGFLISWAMRLATSRQTSMRWALISSVRSVSTTSSPAKRLLIGLRSWVILTARLMYLPCSLTSISFSISLKRVSKALLISGVDLLVDGLRDHGGVILAHHRLHVQRQHAGRLGVDGDDLAADVQGHDAGGDVLQDGLDDAAAVAQLDGAPVQLVAVFLQVEGHAVEFVDQGVELVLGRVVDAHVQVALGDLGGGRDQLFDRHGDALGQVKAQPGGGKDDQDGDEQKKQDVGVLDRVAQDAHLAVLADHARQGVQAAGVAFGKILPGDDQHLVALLDVEGHAVADQLAVLQGVDGGEAGAAQAAVDDVQRQVLVFLHGDARVEDGEDLVAVLVDVDHVELVLQHLLLELVLQETLVLVGVHALLLDHGGDQCPKNARGPR